MQYDDMVQLAKHLNGIKYEHHMSFEEPASGRLEVIIPMTVRESPRKRKLPVLAHSAAFPEDNLRNDSLKDYRAIIDELVAKGIVTDPDQIQLRTIAGGEAEEHMSWATINRAGRDDLGPILGGRHRDVKIVVPIGAIDHHKITELYLFQKQTNVRDKVNTALDDLDGVKTETILAGLAARKDSQNLAEAMVAVLGNNYNLQQDFVEAWNQHAEARKRGGATAPLVIVADKGNAVDADDPAKGGEWQKRTAKREDRQIE